MPPNDNNEKNNHNHKHVEIKSGELKEYIKHNIRHLKEHITSFKKLQDKIDDKHALKSLKNAINHLQKGLDELNHLFQHM